MWHFVIRLNKKKNKIIAFDVAFEVRWRRFWCKTGVSLRRLDEGSPFLRQVVRAVVRLEVDPSSGSQVQPVQVGAVDVTCCPSKHIEEAIYNDHCLRKQTEGKAFKELHPSVDQHIKTVSQCGFDSDCYLSVDSAGFLPPAVEQRPSLVFHITHVHIIAIVFTKGDPSSTKHQEIVAMQNS